MKRKHLITALMNTLLIFTLWISLGYTMPLPAISEFLIVDQFGYRPSAEKIALIRNPITGADAAQSFVPGNSYALINAQTGIRLLQAPPTAWKGGLEDPSSGDKTWRFNFSSITTPGTYYVLDETQQVRSPIFEINEDVYQVVLDQALRTFFYQRAGYPKKAPFAGAGWQDEASHLGPHQDRDARLYSDPNNLARARDLSGGWYDAGDFSKYTNWTASYIISLIQSFTQNPTVWHDHLNIPESGNGTPDILDEVKWGLSWLMKMQNKDGSVLSIVGLDHSTSPPSTAAGPTLYGPATTSSALSAAAAFAQGAKVMALSKNPRAQHYAKRLLERATVAWRWADTHPAVTFYNNIAANGSEGLGSGQQEVDDAGRLTLKLQAAIFLFEVTGEATYKNYIDTHYGTTTFIKDRWADPFNEKVQQALLYYAALPTATPAIATDIHQAYRTALSMYPASIYPKHLSDADPYLAYLDQYTWGSNFIKANQGEMFYDLLTYVVPHFNQVVPDVSDTDAARIAERYLHYLHGVNPMGLVYLSNMGNFGGEKSVNEFYHNWYRDGSPQWDRVGTSLYGPPPGFLTGGPNPGYTWSSCCPSSCTGIQCDANLVAPLLNQPDQKSYLDFNTDWPLNSWQVTENSNGYQIAYIRLLSKFVPSPPATP